MTKLALPVSLSGQTVAFSGNGRKLGYPTANIQSDTALEDGIYFGYADLATYANHPAMIFVGKPVTMGDTERRVEAHVLDIVDQDYYGQELSLKIIHFHRPNQKFDTMEQLLEAMSSDEAAAHQWFKERGQ